MHSFQADVLTLTFPPNGTYVINKQPPTSKSGSPPLSLAQSATTMWSWVKDKMRKRELEQGNGFIWGMGAHWVHWSRRRLGLIWVSFGRLCRIWVSRWGELTLIGIGKESEVWDVRNEFFGRNSKVMKNGWIREKDWRIRNHKAEWGNENFRCMKEGSYPCSYVPIMVLFFRYIFLLLSMERFCGTKRPTCKVCLNLNSFSLHDLLLQFWFSYEGNRETY